MLEGKTLLVVNPAAQRGNGARAGELAERLLREALGAGREGDLQVTLTQAPGHARRLAAAADDFARVVALGGDGVVHEVANGLMERAAGKRPALGVIPVGSGNDYARTLGMSERVAEAVAQLAQGNEQPVDVGRCNGEHFVETLSFGLDAAIALDTVERRARTGQQGTALYLASGIDQLLHHLDTHHLQARLWGGEDAPFSDARMERTRAPKRVGAMPAEGATQVFRGECSSNSSQEPGEDAFAHGARELSANVHLLSVQVGPTYGGGFRIAPEASTSDGLLDLCWAAAPMSVPKATFIFLRAKDAHHVGYKPVHFDRAERLTLRFDEHPPTQIDGEPLAGCTFEIDCLPRALRVLMGSCAGDSSGCSCTGDSSMC